LVIGDEFGFEVSGFEPDTQATFVLVGPDRSPEKVIASGTIAIGPDGTGEGGSTTDDAYVPPGGFLVFRVTGGGCSTEVEIAVFPAEEMPPTATATDIRPPTRQPPVLLLAVVGIATFLARLRPVRRERR
jgi:hypothetical protein